MPTTTRQNQADGPPWCLKQPGDLQGAADAVCRAAGGQRPVTVRWAGCAGSAMGSRW